MTDIQQMLIAQENSGPIKDGRYMPYPDSRGFVTIGYGRCLDRKGISKDEAFYMMSNDIADAIEIARRSCSVYDSLSRPRQLVLLSMAHQLGEQGLLGFTHFLGAVNRGDHAAAVSELLDSEAARQTPLRYRQLSDMWKENYSQWV